MIRTSTGKTAAGRLLLGAGAVALLVTALAGCEAGNGAPTLQFHAASSGAQTVFNNIKITNAFVLGAPAGSTVPSGSSAGLFVSLYNGGSSSDTLLGVTAANTAAAVTLPGGKVTLPVNAAPVNLTGPQPKVLLKRLTTPLTGGTSIPVTFDFQHAGSVTLQVPVEAQSFQWATFSPPASAPSSAASASAKATPTGSSTKTAAGAKTASSTPIASSTKTATP